MKKKLLLILAAVMLAGCSQPTTSSESVRRLGELIESGAGYRQDEEGVVVVHLSGSDAEMRAQYQALLADEIAGFRQAAANHRMMQELGGNCSNFAAFGPASADGKLWHAVNFDFEGYGLLDRYRVVYIVEPMDKIPFVAISWTGYYPWGYPSGVHTAMNAQGLSIGQMASMAPDESFMDIPVLWGLFRQVMENASTIEEALDILETGPRRGALNLLLTDGKVPDAVVVELASDGLAVLPAEDGIVYATNHFVSQEMFYPKNTDPNSYARFERLGDLGALHYGAFDLDLAIAVLRDRYDALAGRDTFGGDTVISYGNMLGVVFHPSDLTFWVANGSAPAAYHKFVGFSLQDELDGEQAQSTVPSVPADPVVGSEAWAEVEAFQAGARAFMRSDDSAAAEHLAEAVSLNPHSALYGYGLASTLVSLGREEEAIAAFEAALAGDSGSSTYAYIYYRLGLIYEAREDEDKMRSAFEQVLALDVGNEEIEEYARRALGQ